jgi:hypothetical protein
MDLIAVNPAIFRQGGNSLPHNLAILNQPVPPAFHESVRV